VTEMVQEGIKKIPGRYEHSTSASYFSHLWVPYFYSLSINYRMCCCYSRSSSSKNVSL